MGQGRKKGTTCDRFEPAALEKDLEHLANLKCPPCDFEMLNYGKTKRSQAADRDGLVEYHPLLAVVLKHAPKGLPTQSLLKLTWNSFATIKLYTK